MDTFGYLILGVIGFIALKAFGGGGSSVPMAAANVGVGLKPNTPIDPTTGAKVINTQPAGFVGPIQPQSRIPATDIGGGKQWCPFPFTLYKDLADGKFYCYNETQPVSTATIDPSSGLIAPPSPNLYAGLSPDVIASQPALEPTNMIPAPDTLQPPDYVQAGDAAPPDVQIVPTGWQLV